MKLKEVTDREKSFLLFNAAVKEGLTKALASLEKLIEKLAGPDYEVRDLTGLPLELLAHLKRLLDRLLETDGEVSDLELTERAAHPGQAKALGKKVERLRDAHHRQLEARVLLEGARAAKKTAMEDYNTSFPDIAKIFECLFRLARHPAWARQLTPSGQDKGLLLAESKLRRAIRAGIKKSKERGRETEPAASGDDRRPRSSAPARCAPGVGLAGTLSRVGAVLESVHARSMIMREIRILSVAQARR